MRRVGIVALARRLAIALWRYLQTGEIPAGRSLKPAAWLWRSDRNTASQESPS